MTCGVFFLTVSGQRTKTHPLDIKETKSLAGGGLENTTSQKVLPRITFVAVCPCNGIGGGHCKTWNANSRTCGKTDW